MIYALGRKAPKAVLGRSNLTAVYLKNRSPSKVLNKTPIEVWHGRKPKVNHFRVFGCDAYAHITKDERAKFDSKTQKCVMLGYGNVTKGYRLHEVAQKRIIHSHDVQFNEGARECSQCKLRQMSLTMIIS